MGSVYTEKTNTNAYASRFSEAASCCAFSGSQANFNTCGNDIAAILGTIVMVSFFVAVLLGILLHISILVLFITCLGCVLPILVECDSVKKSKEQPLPF